MKQDEQELLKKNAVALREVFRRCTNLDDNQQIRKQIRPKKTEDSDGWYVTVATVKVNDTIEIDIDIYYDFYLDSDKQASFWVGFFSETEDEITQLARAASDMFTVKKVDDPKQISEFDIAIIEYLQRYKGDDYQNCLGIYFGPGKRFDLSMAIRFLCEAIKAIPGVEFKFDDVDIDVDAIKYDPSLSDSERNQLIKARRGQGEYRAKLDELWGNACSVLGLTTREILRASHIKPWAICAATERKDGHNGLLLSAHLDALFDKHLITFDVLGEMKVSQKILVSEQEELQLQNRRLRKQPWPELERYLTFHRSEFERKQKDWRTASSSGK